MTTIVHTECDLCKARYRIDQGNLGKKMKCRKCGAAFISALSPEKTAVPRWSTDKLVKPKSPAKSAGRNSQQASPASHSCPKCGTTTVLVSKMSFSPLMLLISLVEFLIGIVVSMLGWFFGYIPVVIGIVIMAYALIRRNTRQASKMVCPNCGWKGKQLL